MITIVRTWIDARSRREQLLLLLMAAIAVPILAWLLLIRPIAGAYDRALVDHLKAIDLHGRVLAMTSSAPAPGRGTSNGDLQLLIPQSAVAAGLTLQRAETAGPDAIDVTAAGAQATVVGQWLQRLEAEGIRVEQFSMTQVPGGTTTMSARLVR